MRAETVALTDEDRRRARAACYAIAGRKGETPDMFDHRMVAALVCEQDDRISALESFVMRLCNVSDERVKTAVWAEVERARQ